MKGLLKTYHKSAYYLSNLHYYLRPNWLRHYDPSKDLNKLPEADLKLVEQRAALLNKLTTPFQLSEESMCIADFVFKKHTAYKIDLSKVLLGYDRERRFDAILGDVKRVSSRPAFLKSRPIVEGNDNSVLLKLNTPRHYSFYKDPYDFKAKKNTVIYRGGNNNTDRKKVVEMYGDHPELDICFSYKKGENKVNYLQPAEQMANKFILSVEGVDVASNLKWVMASNSICVMKKPKIESWFLESQLVAGKHYIEVCDDYSNLEEAIQPYIDDPEKAKQMIHDAHEYMRFLFSPTMERLTSHKVVSKYFDLVR